MTGADGNLTVTWRAILRDGSRYLRQEFTFNAGKQEVPLSGILLMEIKLAGAHATGTVDGSPVATDTAFFGVEHPLSINRGEMGYVRCFLPRGASLLPDESFNCSSVVGFVAKGQLRRDFLAYLERERAHPYRPFLHYNSWYDIGYFSKYDEAMALNVINTFGEELAVKRGVKLDSFMFDDGWDNDATLWQFDKTNFPNGFAPLEKAAAKYGAAPGIWLSPWGGYGKPHEERIKFGQEQGFETRDGNFSLAGPKYLCAFQRPLHGAWSRITASTSSSSMGSVKTPALAAAARNGILTRCSSSSPNCARSSPTSTSIKPPARGHRRSGCCMPIRSGAAARIIDFVSGTAPDRERWISYKDNDVHDEIVGRSDLYPLNSLMLHGIIYAKHAHGLELRHEQHP